MEMFPRLVEASICYKIDNFPPVGAFVDGILQGRIEGNRRNKKPPGMRRLKGWRVASTVSRLRGFLRKRLWASLSVAPLSV
jgi:hypothetical protein